VKGKAVHGGDLSPPEAEAPSSLDPGEGTSGVGGGPTAGPGDASVGCPSGRLWGMSLSASFSDMEIEEETERLRSRKRKSQDTKDCNVVLAPLPIQKKDGKGKKKKKK